MVVVVVVAVVVVDSSPQPFEDQLLSVLQVLWRQHCRVTRRRNFWGDMPNVVLWKPRPVAVVR